MGEPSRSDSSELDADTEKEDEEDEDRDMGGACSWEGTVDMVSPKEEAAEGNECCVGGVSMDLVVPSPCGEGVPKVGDGNW
jgi:hypothetical protein